MPTNTVREILYSQDADNSTLYSLLYFIHLTLQNLDEIDVNAPIETIDPDLLVLAVVFFELHQGIDLPDEMLENKTKTLRQLAEEIQTLPKISDEEFRGKLLRTKAVSKSVVDHN
jgi:hypothetical protein